MVRDAEALEERERAVLTALCQACPEVAHAYDLAQRFIYLVRARHPAGLAAWLAAAQQGPPEVRRFARGITRDQAAVQAALRLPWSQCHVEGQVQRTKLIQRLMFGRGSLDLLRRDHGTQGVRRPVACLALVRGGRGRHHAPAYTGWREEQADAMWSGGDRRG